MIDDMHNNLFRVAPWAPLPTYQKRRAPGIAVPGRRWPRIALTDLAGMVGNIFADCADGFPYDTLEVAVTAVMAPEGPLCDLKIEALRYDSPPLDSSPPGFLEGTIEAILQARGGSADIQLMFHRSGYWVELL